VYGGVIIVNVVCGRGGARRGQFLSGSCSSGVRICRRGVAAENEEAEEAADPA
jgi:hypothetical protein